MRHSQGQLSGDDDRSQRELPTGAGEPLVLDNLDLSAYAAVGWLRCRSPLRYCRPV